MPIFKTAFDSVADPKRSYDNIALRLLMLPLFLSFYFLFGFSGKADQESERRAPQGAAQDFQDVPSGADCSQRGAHKCDSDRPGVLFHLLSKEPTLLGFASSAKKN